MENRVGLRGMIAVICGTFVSLCTCILPDDLGLEHVACMGIAEICVFYMNWILMGLMEKKMCGFLVVELQPLHCIKRHVHIT